MTRETVATETPAALATFVIDNLGPFKVLRLKMM